jgi:hypothetical protein
MVNNIITNNNVPQNWLNLFTFKRSQRNVNINIPKNRINLCDRNVFFMQLNYIIVYLLIYE